MTNQELKKFAKKQADQMKPLIEITALKNVVLTTPELKQKFNDVKESIIENFIQSASENVEGLDDNDLQELLEMIKVHLR